MEADAANAETAALHPLGNALTNGVEVDTSQVRRLLEDFVPEDEEPAEFEGRDDMPPMEQRMRARSGPSWRDVRSR